MLTRRDTAAVWVAGAGGLLALALAAGPARAVVTPFSQQPAAFCTYDYGNNGLVWDYELAAKLNAGTGRRITVMDFCHSGGFVAELASRPLSYAAAAAGWDEISYGVFGKTFMSYSKNHTLHESYVEATSKVINKQLPQEGGDLGGARLNYLNGDRAVIFSASDGRHAADVDFWGDVTTARDALKNQSGLPWPDSDTAKGPPISCYYGDGATVPNAGGYQGAPGWLEGSATRGNLFGAIDAAVTDPAFTDISNLFLYINDHGTSTDVVKSRYEGNHFAYETAVSLWRGWTDNNPYGIWRVRHRLLDPAAAHYDNILFNHFSVNPATGELERDWMGHVGAGADAGWMIYESLHPGERRTWLTSGLDYGFGYDYLPEMGTPGHVRWEDYRVDGSGNRAMNDHGEPDGSEWGMGGVVYSQDRMVAQDYGVHREIANDPWPGWMNGGDGWVWAPVPIPEPSAILVLVSGIAGMLAVAVRRRTR